MSKPHWLDKYRAELGDILDRSLIFGEGDDLIRMTVVEYIAYREQLKNEKPKNIIAFLKTLPVPPKEEISDDFFGFGANKTVKIGESDE